MSQHSPCKKKTIESYLISGLSYVLATIKVFGPALLGFIICVQLNYLRYKCMTIIVTLTALITNVFCLKSQNTHKEKCKNDPKKEPPCVDNIITI